MDNMLNEAEAWREAARRIEQNGVDFGICWLLRRMTYDGTISWITKDDMDRRISFGLTEREDTGELYDAFLYPEGEPDERILYCLFTALLCEDGE